MNLQWPAPEPCNVAAALGEQARRRPDAIAIHFPVGRTGRARYAACSYSRLDTLSDDCARGLLALGLAPGDRAALMVPPGLEFFALFFALFKAGIVPVLIDPGIGQKHLRKCLRETAPAAFIGVTRAQAASVLLRWSPGSIRHRVTIGPRLGWGGERFDAVARLGSVGEPVPLCRTDPEDLAAILFTSGSTGVPKGVVYRHRQFHHQVQMLREHFGIEPGEVDLATFPPFALFDPALGMTTVVPKMDPTRPAKADPAKLVQAIERFGVTHVFGSPALLNNLGRFTDAKELKLPKVRRVLSAGAAVPVDTVHRVESALGEGARVHTPYGATECLPVASISGAELDEALAARTREGAGTCVGRPVPPNRVDIMAITDEAVPEMAPYMLLDPGEIGEIIVHGPTATDGYWQREDATQLARTEDGEGRAWHRMGDVGYFDDDGRLWFCGRKSQRVRTEGGDLFADQIEAVFNTHPAVARTALVGVGPAGRQRPVLCVEMTAGKAAPEEERDRRMRGELLDLAAQRLATSAIETVLFHPSFPVDIRHNSKIGREALAVWAGKQLK